MPKLSIHNVEVDFPKEPYPCQVEYIKKVLQAITDGHNALLESPTGTGKTLSLLCSTLAWQSHARRETKMTRPIKPDPLEKLLGGPSDAKGKKTSLPFTIVYCSRTHSQLTQVVAELRTTAYRPKVAVLGSREQLCVHDKISKLPRLAVNSACQNLNNKHACSYKSNLEGYQGAVEGAGDSPSPIYDIEDLVKVGRRDNICPYYYSRDFSEYADIIFLPYNYLLDTSIRSTLNVRWEQSVVVFDEAHNIEKVASDAASFSMSSSEIATCIRELQQVLEYIQAHKGELDSKAKDASSAGAGLPFSSGSGVSDPPTLLGVTRVLRAMFEFERRVEQVPLTKGAVGDSTSCALTGDWMLKTLIESGFEFAMIYKNIDEIMRCSELLTHMAQDAFEGALSTIGSGAAGTSPPTEPKLTYFAYSLRRVFKGNTVQAALDSARDYKVFICEDTSVPKSHNQQTTIPSFAVAKKRVLNYWAFSPGIAMEELRGLQVRSIILTSGTLSPLDSFKEDLKIPFMVELTNPHVIQRNQIWVGALPFGPTGKVLNSSYNMRGKNEYKDELGMSVLSICETSRGFSFNNSRTYGGLTVPTGPDMKGGVLVFFPSYSVMENTIERWKETNIYEKLESICCAIVIEPKGSSSASTRSQAAKPGFAGASSNKSKGSWGGKKLAYEDDTVKKPKVSFTGSANKTPAPSSTGDADAESQVAMGALIAEFDAALAKHGNCMLMAVCRGKVSEGIDFSDNRGRVVIITGLPYAPFQDPWVVLKRQFLDELCFQQPSVQIQHANVTSIGSGYASAMVPKIAPSAQPVKPVTSGSVGFRSAVRRLNGEAWYAQSASRAVNQAIGRVIRHKNDWGAIFFLDDRFVRSQQQAQLSGWVRPSTQTYEKIGDALRNYRDFVSAALSNPLLTTTTRSSNDVPMQPKVERRIPPQYKQVSDPSLDGDSSAKTLSEMFPKEVVLRQDKLLQSSQFNSDDNYFVCPDLLSQQVEEPPVSTKPAVSSQVSYSQVQHPSAELDGFLSKLSQSRVHRNSSSNSLFAKPSVVKSPPKSSIAHIFNTAPAAKSSSMGVSVDAGRRNLTLSKAQAQRTNGVSLYSLQGSSSYSSSSSSSRPSTGFGLSGFGLSSLSQDTALTSLSQQQPKSSTATNDSEPLTQSKKPSFSLPTFERPQAIVLTPEQTIQRAFDKLTTLEGLSSGLIDSLRQETRRRRHTGVMTDAETVKECVDAFAVVAIAALPDWKVEECLLEIISALCSVELRNEMKQYARKRFVTVAKREAKKIKLEEEDRDLVGDEYSQNENRFDSNFKAVGSSSMSQTTQNILSSVENSATKPTKVWQPSFRAKQVSQAVQEMSSVRVLGGKSSSEGQAKLSFQARLDHMKLKKDGDTTASTSGGPLQCGICKENRIVPCIAQCGHVCCGPCWQGWIKKREASREPVTCPMCRQPASVESIRRVKLM